MFRKLAFLGAAVFGMLVVATAIAPKVRAAVKAALVEVVAPSHPVMGLYTFTSANSNSNEWTIGPGTGSTLAISSITVIAYGPTWPTQDVHIFEPTSFYGSNKCGSSGPVVSGANTILQPRAQQNQVLHLTFPTPITLQSGCLGFQSANTIPANSSVVVQVVGYYN